MFYFQKMNFYSATCETCKQVVWDVENQAEHAPEENSCISRDQWARWDISVERRIFECLQNMRWCFALFECRFGGMPVCHQISGAVHEISNRHLCLYVLGCVEHGISLKIPRHPCNIYCMPSMPLHGKRKTVCLGLKRFVTLLRTDTTQLHVYIYTIYVGCYMLYM